MEEYKPRLLFFVEPHNSRAILYANLSFTIRIRRVFGDTSSIRHLEGSDSEDRRLNRPTLLLNDEPQSPFFYSLTDVPGGRNSWEELPQHNIRQFAAQGVTLFQLDLALDFLWREDGSFSVEAAQKQVRGVLEVCLGATIFLRLHVRPLKWWMRQNPQENTTYFGGDSMADFIV